MDEQQKAAYIMSQSSCAMIEAMGMQAENQMCKLKGESLAYGEKQFNDIILRYGIDHNSVVSFFRG